jgi:predicted GTPase
MSDTEEDVPLPPPLHQTAYELLTSVLPQIEARVGCKEMPTELWDTLGQIKDRVGSFETKTRTVAVVGRTGVGKSTLICALLKCSFLPSSAAVSISSYSTAVKMIISFRRCAA